MTATTDLVVTVWPGIEPRLLRRGTEGYSEYRASGGYRRLDDPDGLLSQVDLSGVLGRGGAAFPLAVKLKTVRDNGRRSGGAVVVANGEEGEPASIKDRWLECSRSSVAAPTTMRKACWQASVWPVRSTACPATTAGMWSS